MNIGLAMGEEAVFTTEMNEEKDGIIGPDLMRLGLERSRNCREAIQVMTELLEKYGQGGSAELKGNSHFDSSFLMADTSEAYILETAGEEIGQSSRSMRSVRSQICLGSGRIGTSVRKSGSEGELDWAARYGLSEVPPTLGSPDRQATTYSCLTAAEGRSHPRRFST